MTARHLLPILIADDDEEDRLIAAEALVESRLANPLYFVRDGEELMEFLQHRGRFTRPGDAPRPGLILLDLRMPKRDGLQVLADIKSDPELRQIPVVVLSSSSMTDDILRSYDLGVSSYITKPVTFAGLVEAMKIVGRYWFQIVELPELPTGRLERASESPMHLRR